ncbi:MAG: tetratricopeptide repeat protein [Deltaproteobacteria bacterium]|nr:tetratricopeptide repeat protein [Deltaproteobacteria bacterium]
MSALPRFSPVLGLLLILSLSMPAVTAPASAAGSYEQSLQQARAALAGNDLAGARAAVERALAVKPNDPKALNLQGMVLHREKRYAESLALLTRVVEAEPSFAAAWANRANAALALKQYDNALADAGRALQLSPNLAVCHLTRASAFNGLKKPAEAKKEADAALRLKPGDPHALYLRALTEQNLGQMPEALADVEQVLTKWPDHANSYLVRAIARGALGQPQAALADADRVIAMDPGKNAAFRVKGESLAALGRPQDALAAFDQAIKLNPDNGKAYASRGQVYAQLGRTEQARADLAQAVRIHPEEAAYRAELAKVDTVVAGGNTRVGGGDTRVGGADTRVGGADTRVGGADTRVGGGDTQAGGGGTRVGGGGLPPDPGSGLDPSEQAALEALPSPLFDLPPQPAEQARLSPKETQALDDPCAGLNLPEGDEEPPAASGAGPDLSRLQTPLAQNLGKLTKRQYAGVVTAAREATRMLLGQLTPEEEARFNRAWLPLADYPSYRVAAYLDRLNPLLVEFLSLKNAAEMALVSVEDLNFEAEMALAYEQPTASQETLAGMGPLAGQLKEIKARMAEIIRRVQALGDPPNPLEDKCRARRRFKKALAAVQPAAAPPGKPSTGKCKFERAPGWDYHVPEKVPPAPWDPWPNLHATNRFWAEVAGSSDDFLKAELIADLHYVYQAQNEQGVYSPPVWSGRRFTVENKDTGFDKFTCAAKRQYKYVIEGELSEDGRTLKRLWGLKTERFCVRAELLKKGYHPKGAKGIGAEGDDGKFEREFGEVEFVDLPLLSYLPGPNNPYVCPTFVALTFGVKGPQAARHIKTVYVKNPTFKPGPALAVQVHLDIDVATAGAGSAAPPDATPDPAKLKAEKIDFHQKQIELLTEDIRRYQAMLAKTTDPPGRLHLEYVLTGKDADLQQEKDAITTLQTGQFTRTRTAFDEMVAGQMRAQGRALAAKINEDRYRRETLDRVVKLLPADQQAQQRRWAEDQIKAKPGDAEHRKKVLKAVATKAGGLNQAEAAAYEEDAAEAQCVVDVLENYQKAAQIAMYATPFVTGGSTLALVYGLTQGGIQGYQTGGLLGPEYQGWKGAATGGMITAARYIYPNIDYALTFYEGSVTPDASGQPGGWWGGLKAVGSTYVQRKITQKVVGTVQRYQAAAAAARKQARLDAWQNAQRRVEFRQQREWGKNLVDEHQRLYNEFQTAKRSGAPPQEVARLENRLLDMTAAIKHAPHAKGYLKFNCTRQQKAAYEATSRLHTARVVRQFRQELENEGFDTQGLTFRPIRNAGNTSPGMDLDLAVFTDLNRVQLRDPAAPGGSRQLDLYTANQAFQRTFARVYAQNSGGRSAKASWQMVTTSRHLEAYRDLAWLRVKRVGAAGQNPLAQINPQYAADAARVTEVKAHEMQQQAGLGRDNQVWEIYRGTAKDIDSKVLPNIYARMQNASNPAVRAKLRQNYEFYQQLSRAMQLANHDPVAAEQAVRGLTGYDAVDVVHMTSAGIEALGKFSGGAGRP